MKSSPMFSNVISPTTMPDRRYFEINARCSREWFVKEQIEEETLVNNLLDQYNLASDQKRENVNLYALDRDFADAPQEAVIPREEEF